MLSLSDRIKTKALEIGFTKVGIAAAGALIAERERLTDWLGRGLNGSMAWLEREPEKRTDPRVLFPAARSVVVLALNYYTDHHHEPDIEKGKVSRYAWGDDYHDVVREKLNELLAWIRNEIPGIEGKVCVDTAPMMDKAWAIRAGLGWIGKSSNLITTDVGSWVFIGEIILNIDLDYDEPVIDHCGTCTACIDACPTDAILEPYVVDATRCISYATIELRDETMPDEFTGKMDGWIYGCDICQEICPWNRFEKPTNEPRFEPRHGEISLDLQTLAEMDHDEYVVRFRKSAIKRAKLAGLKRNAAALTADVVKPD